LDWRKPLITKHKTGFSTKMGALYYYDYLEILNTKKDGDSSLHLYPGAARQADPLPPVLPLRDC
jgi:hypothetical protein